MNRLWVRLSIAFVFVALISAAAVAWLASTSADTQFRQFLARRDTLEQSGLLDQLAAFYQHTGSWNGVNEVLANFTSPGAGRGQGQGRGRPALLLADVNSHVVYDERGTRVGDVLSDQERTSTLPITLDGNIVGYLWLDASGRGALSPTDQSYLDQLRNTLMVAALIASGLGIAIGLLISRTLAAPLSTLAGAAHAFAAHQWDRRVKVNGTQEIAEVSHAFNDMADSLQQAEVLRRNLIADVAHELRTPLTVLQGNLRAILDGVYPLEKSEIATVYDETRLLNRLVDDLRELALAEAGQLKLNLSAIDLRPLIDSTAASFALAADEQQIAFKVSAANDLPLVQADADRFAQVLRNLIGNALQHTTIGGQITISTKTNSATIEVSVTDTGEGIAAEDLPHVFDRFYRSDKSRARRSGGSGLGLAIAKALIETMGGQIGLDSKVGQGSRFWFTLPRAA